MRDVHWDIRRGVAAKAVPAGTTAKGSITPGCSSNPETTKIRNNTSATTTIQPVGSLYKPRSNEPFSVNKGLGAGKSITY